MKRKMYSVYTLVREIGESYFSMNIRVDGVTKTAFTAEDFQSIFLSGYADRLYLGFWDDSQSKENNIFDTANTFHTTFQRWAENMKENAVFLWRALYEEYNPLENYDRKEEGGWTDAHHKGSKTETARKETVTPNLSTTQTEEPRAKVKSSDFLYGVNSASASPTGYNETEGVSGQNTTTQTQTGTSETEAQAQDNYTITKDLSESEFDKDVRTMDSYRVHGNIGVTKATDLIQAELETRRANLAEYLVTDFLEKYTFFCDCGEVVE